MFLKGSSDSEQLGVAGDKTGERSIVHVLLRNLGVNLGGQGEPVKSSKQGNCMVKFTCRKLTLIILWKNYLRG